MDARTFRLAKIFVKNIMFMLLWIGGMFAYTTGLWLIPEPYNWIIALTVVGGFVSFLVWSLSANQLNSLEHKERMLAERLSRE